MTSSTELDHADPLAFGSGGTLAQRLVEQGYELTMFKEDEINLETAFMHLTKGITS